MSSWGYPGELPSPSPERDIRFMRMALDQAEIAASLGEVPVGAVICRGDEVVSTAYNTRESDKNALAHAELTAIDRACRALGGWRLHQCDLYVTLEPCPMCAGAIINARIRRVVFGAFDPKAGCFGSVQDFSALPFNHRPEIVPGVEREACSHALKLFFSKMRKNASD